MWIRVIAGWVDFATIAPTMNSVRFILSLCAVLLTGLAAFAAPSRPNIVFFLSDDHGIDFVGCYGNKVIQTPNIDSLAKQGAQFSRVFAASPTCSPSRAVLWTGMHSARNGTMGNHTDCKPDIKSLPHWLKPLGYRVVLANKADVRPKEVFDFEYLQATLPRNPQINRRYRGEGLDTKAVDAFLASHSKEHPDQPLCLLLCDNGPHVVWEKNKTYDPAKLPIPPFMVDTPKTRTALANYYQDITSVDDRVGDVMASLKKHGLEENTLFLYSSDQGPEWPHAKWTCYDTGLHVPFIARWPGVLKPGSTIDALISFVDITPTFVDFAGGKQPPGLDGKSFKDVLLGKRKSFDEFIYACHTRDGNMNIFPQRCVRDSRYKFILNLNPENKWTTHFTKVPGIPDSHAEVYSTWVEKAKTDAAAAKLVKTIEWHKPEELYDLQKDPYELNNLIDDPAQQKRVKTMRAKLQAWLKHTGDAAKPETDKP